MAMMPTTPDEILDLVEDILFVDLKTFTSIQLHDLARMARHIARASEEEARRRDVREANQRETSGVEQ